MAAPDLRALNDRAQALRAQGRLDDAITEFRALLARVPRDLAARQKLADTLAHRGRVQEAVVEYQHVAGAYALDGMLLKAMAVCRALLALDPAHTETQQMLGQLLARKQDAASRVVLPGFMAEVDRERRAYPSEEVDLGLDVQTIYATNFPGTSPTATPSTTSAPADDRTEEEPVVVSARPDTGPTTEVVVLDTVEVVLAPGQLPRIPLFSGMPAEAFVELFPRLGLRAFPAGTVVLHEGATGDSMFIIVQGRVRVLRPGKVNSESVATLEDGACFGEMAVLGHLPRMATVTADRDTLVLELTRADAEHVSARHPTVAAAVQRLYRMRLLHTLVRASPVFKPLTQEQQQGVLDASHVAHVPAGTEVIRQGRAVDGLHVLLRGRARVSARDARGDMQDFPGLREGDVFGEIALALDTQATATVTATTDSVLLVVPAAAFAAHVRANPAAARVLAELGAARLGRMGVEEELDLGLDA